MFDGPKACVEDLGVVERSRMGKDAMVYVEDRSNNPALSSVCLD